MDLMDLLKSAGAGDSVENLSKQLGLSSGDAGSLIKALSPALTRGLQRQNESPDAAAKFAQAVQKGTHQRYIDNPETLTDETTRLDGNKILGHLFGSKDVSRNVAAHASGETGIDSSLIKKALPFLATLVMAAVSKKSNSGKELAEESSGGLGSLTKILFSKGESGIDDIINLARKFF